VLGAAEPRLRPLSYPLAALAEEVSCAVRPDRIRADVVAISGPRTRLRSPGAKHFESLIQSRFSEAGWITEQKPFTCMLPPLDPALTEGGLPGMPIDHKNFRGVNVVAKRRETSEGLPVVIGAHYDTVPRSPGADDNGSGVAALLELARVLNSMPVRVPVILAAFDHEELGLLGSRAFVEDISSAGGARLAVIYECIGYCANELGAQRIPPGLGAIYRKQAHRMRRRGLIGDETIVLYEGSSAFAARYLGEHIAQLADRDHVVLLRSPANLPGVGRIIRRRLPAVKHFARSDHFSFWGASLPAVLITDTANMRNPHYHQESDTPDTLDYLRIAHVVTATAILILRLGGFK
jgi:hypothetical protein